MHPAHVHAVHDCAGGRCAGVRAAGTDHRITRHQRRELFFGPAVGLRRTLGYDEIADLCGRIPHPQFNIISHGDAEIIEHAARIDHRARSIRGGLVPDRWQAQDRPWIARAQCADDHVVHARCVLQRNHLFALAATVAERCDGGGGIVE
jgi:hypothetical protein